MAAAELIKNIEYFLGTILHKASYSGDWNEKSISDAFMWAEFCKQIHKKYLNEPVGMEIDKHIHNLTLKSGFSWCFDSLEHAVSHLTEAFYQNPMIEKQLLESALMKVKPQESNIQEVKNDAELLGNLCNELIECIKPISFSNSKQSLYYEIKTELFLNFLTDLSRQLSNEEQSETQLSLAFEMLCQSPEKMMIIIHVLLYDLPEESKQILEIQNFGVNWLLLKLLEEPNGPLASLTWSLPPSSLTIISTKFAPFHSFYMDYLTKATYSLQPEYTSCGRKWNKGISTNQVILSYEEVASHFQSLIQGSEDVSNITKGYLLELRNSQAVSPVWKDLWTFLQCH